MPSTLTWLAHDEAERRRLQEAVALFREQGTLDDLGVGSVRDAFSNLVFPGTSVLQTRARYFLFVPWIYRRLERAGGSARDVAARARRDELRLIDALLAGREKRGVIGERARANLKLLPSTAYWSGLGRLGFRLFQGTQEQYHRSFDSYRQLLRNTPRVADDEEPVALRYSNWHPTLDGLAEAAGDFLSETEFRLSGDEGAFVRELIVVHARESYLANLCVSGSRSDASYPWLHPIAQRASPRIQRQLELARAFSALMQGASILYNLMLAERRELISLAETLREQLNVWAAELAGEDAAFDWEEFWEIAHEGNPRISMPTRSFVSNWAEYARALGPQVATESASRELIARRERQTKHGQARLWNARRLETWNEPVGMGRLDFRWPVVRQIVNDLAQTARRPRA